MLGFVLEDFVQEDTGILHVANNATLIYAIFFVLANKMKKWYFGLQRRQHTKYDCIGNYFEYFLESQCSLFPPRRNRERADRKNLGQPRCIGISASIDITFTEQNSPYPRYFPVGTLD